MIRSALLAVTLGAAPALAQLASPAPASAQDRTHTRTEMCWYLGKQNHPYIERGVCTITDVRRTERYGNEYLVSRSIFAQVGNSVTGRKVQYLVLSKGDKTWDSDCQCTYRRPYSVANVNETVARESQLPTGYAITEVTKDLWVRQISWD